MSNHTNHRRDEDRHTEHGPRWECSDTDRNSARARSSWKRIRSRSWRRNGAPTPKVRPNARPTPRPGIDESDEVTP